MSVRRDILWSKEETEFALSLFGQMSGEKIAIQMMEKFGRPFTRGMVIGKMKRLRDAGNGISKRPSTNKPRAKFGFTKTLRWSRPTTKSIIIRRESLAPRYMPPMTCQYIGDTPGKCGKASHGPWCEEHKVIVFKR